MIIRINQYYILYFFIYSFLGWMLEVAVTAVGSHRFANRGMLNLPLCISYGIIMDLLIMVTRENTIHGFIMFLLSLVIVSATEFFAGYMADKFVRRRLWDYMNMSAFGGQAKGFLNSFVISFGFFTCLKLVHPMVYFIVHLIPGSLRLLLCLILCSLLVLDFLFLLYAHGKQGRDRRLDELKKSVSSGKRDFGRKISDKIISRIDRAYPPAARAVTAEGILPAEEEALPAEECGEGGEEKNARTAVFAKGMCFDKAVWIMLFFGVVGNLCETLLVRYQTGIWMRRGSLVFLPVSLVWGMGGVLFTVLLLHFAHMDDRYVFLGGFFFGGTYEYLCSVFTETFLGTRFWDYHNMPFNIDGRTNLLFMFIWGFVSLLWIKFGYPRVSSLIERIDPPVGKAATWLIVILLSMDILLSGAVILRSALRQEDARANNFIEAYIDENYPDEVVKRNWRNIRFGPNRPDELQRDEPQGQKH